MAYGEGPADPKTKRVLIADDDDNVRSFLETFVKNEGFEVFVAVNGLDAIEKIAKTSPHLVITDLKMPGEGGYEVLKKLQGEGTSRIPVVVITATKLDPSTVEMIEREANVVAFLPKPIEVPNFLATLHQTLRTLPPEKKRWPSGPAR